MARSGFHPYKLFKEFMAKCCTWPSPIRWYLYLEQVILLQVISFSRDSLQRVIMFGDMGKWDQFTAQVEPIASTVTYMVGSGNHERDWPDSGSFYDTMDSGEECGVPAEMQIFYVPAENRAKYWYSTDYTEHDWRVGSEQYRFIEECLATVDRQKQPWLIFAAHRPSAIPLVRIMDKRVLFRAYGKR